MMGFAGRDRERGCEGVHDELYVRALYLEHGGEEALILGLDLCLPCREDVDRYKGAIGRRMDMAPRRILLNASHTHSGPSVGRWAYAAYAALDRLYHDELELAVVAAACEAREAAVEVTLWAGETRSALPMSRRSKDEHGKVQFRPNPEGVVYDFLPVCLLRDSKGDAICLMFSVSCHPSNNCGHYISADYPGVAMELLDKHLGGPASLFLQGVGGDAKACVINRGDHWGTAPDTWGEIAEAGTMVAEEVIALLDAGLVQVEPEVRAHSVETRWPLAPAMDRAGYQVVIAEPDSTELKRLWAGRQIERMDRGEQLAETVPVSVHGVQLGRGLRLIGIEGEAVAGLGFLIRNLYAGGATFPLGYTDGGQLYLPTEDMLDEGGYEVDSYYEYGYPAPLAKGFERTLTDALGRLRMWGVA